MPRSGTLKGRHVRRRSKTRPCPANAFIHQLATSSMGKLRSETCRFHVWSVL